MTDEIRHKQNIAYCREQVKKQAEDLYLASQFAPATDNDRLVALYAFACEINRIPTTVSEPPLGAIRQQWWLDALEEVFSGAKPRAHPVVEALALSIPSIHYEHFHKQMTAAVITTGPFLEFGSFKSAEEVVVCAEKIHGYAAGLAAKLLNTEQTGSEEQRSAIVRLSALTRIASLIAEPEQSQLQLPQPGTTDPFNIRLGRFVAIEREQFLAFLADDFAATSLKFGHPETVIMPALAHISLFSHYLKSCSQNSHENARKRRSFLPLTKRMILVRAILRGRPFR